MPARHDRRRAVPGVTPGLGRPLQQSTARPGRTLPHLRSHAPDPKTWPSEDDPQVQDTVNPYPAVIRRRRFLNEPHDGVIDPAGVRAFDSEAPIISRTADNPSLPEAKIVRIAATGVPADPYEWELDRYDPNARAEQIARRPRYRRR